MQKRMGKKGNWISVLKKAFTPKSKAKDGTGSENYGKEKQQQGVRSKKQGEISSFIPLHREPSSIEKILGDVEKERQSKARQESHQKDNLLKSPIRRQHSNANTLKNVVSEKAETAFSDRKMVGASCNTKSIISRKQAAACSSKPVTTNFAHISATKIQAAYKGYLVRKSYKALKGLLRLKSMMNGQSVKQQTMNTMRNMQLLVRIQTQIHSRRHQMLEKQKAHQHQISWRSSNETFSGLSKWNTSNQMERESRDDWDDSMLTKEESEASEKKKVEAIRKRERALAYAYSQKLLKISPKTAQMALSDARSDGYPLWWNWLERQIPSDSNHAKIPPLDTPKTSSVTTTAGFTLHRPNRRGQPAKPHFDSSTPHISNLHHTHNSSNRWQAIHETPLLRDDASLTSCPGFAVPQKSTTGTSSAQTPNYMAPTVSAKAKVKSTAMDGDGGRKEGRRRRFSFALSQSIGSLKMFTSAKGAAAATPPVKTSGFGHRSQLSIGDLSVDSTVSLPAGLLRRPFI